MVWLTLGDQNVPVFHIAEEDLQNSKLEVRWKTSPKDLKTGAVEYKVSIVTGSDSELVVRQVSHSGKETQKCVFKGEDWNDL